MSDEETRDSGSFITGFTIGMFAGAAGYFMFGTTKGKQVREKLATEWEKAKGRVAEEAGIDEGEIGLGEVVKKAKRYLNVFLSGVEKTTQQSIKKDSKQLEQKRSARKYSKKLFKGV